VILLLYIDDIKDNKFYIINTDSCECEVVTDEFLQECEKYGVEIKGSETRSIYRLKEIKKNMAKLMLIHPEYDIRVDEYGKLGYFSCTDIRESAKLRLSDFCVSMSKSCLGSFLSLKNKSKLEFIFDDYVTVNKGVFHHLLANENIIYNLCEVTRKDTIDLIYSNNVGTGKKLLIFDMIIDNKERFKEKLISFIISNAYGLESYYSNRVVKEIQGYIKNYLDVDDFTIIYRMYRNKVYNYMNEIEYEASKEDSKIKKYESSFINYYRFSLYTNFERYYHLKEIVPIVYAYMQYFAPYIDDIEIYERERKMLKYAVHKDVFE
jgi:hypothetical protein